MLQTVEHHCWKEGPIREWTDATDVMVNLEQAEIITHEEKKKGSLGLQQTMLHPWAT